MLPVPGGTYRRVPTWARSGTSAPCPPRCAGPVRPFARGVCACTFWVLQFLTNCVALLSHICIVQLKTQGSFRTLGFQVMLKAICQISKKKLHPPVLFCLKEKNLLPPDMYIFLHNLECNVKYVLMYVCCTFSD